MKNASTASDVPKNHATATSRAIATTLPTNVAMPTATMAMRIRRFVESSRQARTRRKSRIRAVLTDAVATRLGCRVCRSLHTRRGPRVAVLIVVVPIPLVALDLATRVVEDCADDARACTRELSERLLDCA